MLTRTSLIGVLTLCVVMIACGENGGPTAPSAQAPPAASQPEAAQAASPPADSGAASADAVRRAGSNAVVEGAITYSHRTYYGYAVGATVSIVDRATGRVAARTSAGLNGRYSTSIPPGRYIVRAEYQRNGTWLHGSFDGIDTRGSSNQPVRKVTVNVLVTE
jgi:hypothetical protein